MGLFGRKSKKEKEDVSALEEVLEKERPKSAASTKSAKAKNAKHVSIDTTKNDHGAGSKAGSKANSRQTSAKNNKAESQTTPRSQKTTSSCAPSARSDTYPDKSPRTHSAKSSTMKSPRSGPNSARSMQSEDPTQRGLPQSVFNNKTPRSDDDDGTAFQKKQGKAGHRAGMSSDDENGRELPKSVFQKKKSVANKQSPKEKYVVPEKLEKKNRMTGTSIHSKAEPTAHSAVRAAMRTDTMNNFLKKNTQEIMSSLTPEVRRAFETLYDRIDMSDSGGISAKEIQNLISKHTTKNLTIGEVQSVLQDLDMNGTGDIEFNEFIFMLSQPENYIRLLDHDDLEKIMADITDMKLKTKLKDLIVHNKGKSTPTNTFFRALRCATQQDSMTALRTFYRNRLKKLNDHVIHDWSAGQRCIGLSDQEMLKRYETIQGELLRQRVNFCKDNSYRSSPYARPLEWGLVTLREGIEERRLKLNREVTKLQTERRAKISEFVCTPKAVPLPKYVIAKRHPLKKTFDYDQLADIREKVDNIATTYYNDLKDIARENSKIVKKELAVGDIKAVQSRQNFNCTFKAYCAPFVVSPWIPMPRPTLQASFTPLGKSKLACQRNW